MFEKNTQSQYSLFSISCSNYVTRYGLMLWTWTVWLRLVFSLSNWKRIDSCALIRHHTETPRGWCCLQAFLVQMGQEQVSLDVLQKLQFHLLGEADMNLTTPDYSCSTCVANRCCINDGQSGVWDDTHTGWCMGCLKSCGRRVIQLFYAIQCS